MRPIEGAALLLYSFGAYAFGAMLVLWARQRAGARRTGEALPSAVEAAISILSFAWFVSCILLTLRGAIPGSRPWFLQTVLLCIAFTFPPLILHAFVAAARDGRCLSRPRAWGRGVVLHYALSTVVALAAIAGFWGELAEPRRVALFANLALAASFVVAAVLSIHLVGRIPDRTEHDRSGRRWMTWLLGFVVLLSMSIVVLGSGRIPFAEVVGIVQRSLPLMFLLVGAYFEDRFVFVDRFLKGGVLLGVTALLLAGALAVAERLLAPIPLGGMRVWVLALAMLPVAALLPWLSGALSRAVDALWLGRKWRSDEAVERFFTALQGAPDERALLQAARSEISELFRAPVEILLGAAAGPLPPGALEASLPVPGSEDGRVRVGPRPDRIPLLSEDAAMLSTQAKVLGAMLATVRLQERERELRLHASEAELKALHAQIRPHFLFNALNAVAGLIRKDPALADRTVERLADVLRYTLRRSESGFATVADEVEFVRAYLEVERARFGERLAFVIDVDPRAAQALVPTMTLQTLVENAVKHGAALRREGGRVAITVRREESHLRIAVEDDGPGPTGEGRSLDPGGVGGYGLDNLSRRLHACYGDAAEVSLRRNGARGVTVASVRVPARAAAAAGEGR